MRRSDRAFRVVRAVVAVLGVVVVASGCTVHGTPGAQYPDPKSFDVGAFSIYPLQEPPGGEQYGRVVESTRMAEALMSPVEADPALTRALGSYGVHLLPTPAKATLLLAAPVRAVLEREGMLAGASVGGTEARATSDPAVGSVRVLSLLVLRFPDPGAAQRAARDIDAVDAAMSRDNVAIDIAGYPAAHAHWRPGVPTAAATVADGAFVVSMYIGETAPDAMALTGLARKAFDAQLPRLRDFAATPREKLAALPLDRDGMLRRMVPEAPGHWAYPIVLVNTPQREASWNQVIRGQGVVYGPRASRLWLGDPQADSRIELHAINGPTNLVRYSSASAARSAYDKGVRDFSSDPTKQLVPGPAGIPDVICAKVTLTDTSTLVRYGCRVLHERYQATLIGPDLTNVRQRAAAQYGLFVNGG